MEQELMIPKFSAPKLIRDEAAQNLQAVRNRLRLPDPSDNTSNRPFNEVKQDVKEAAEIANLVSQAMFNQDVMPKHVVDMILDSVDFNQAKRLLTDYFIQQGVSDADSWNFASDGLIEESEIDNEDEYYDSDDDPYWNDPYVDEEE